MQVIPLKLDGDDVDKHGGIEVSYNIVVWLEYIHATIERWS